MTELAGFQSPNHHYNYYAIDETGDSSVECAWDSVMNLVYERRISACGLSAGLFPVSKFCLIFHLYARTAVKDLLSIHKPFWISPSPLPFFKCRQFSILVLIYNL